MSELTIGSYSSPPLPPEEDQQDPRTIAHRFQKEITSFSEIIADASKGTEELRKAILALHATSQKILGSKEKMATSHLSQELRTAAEAIQGIIGQTLEPGGASLCQAAENREDPTLLEGLGKQFSQFTAQTGTLQAELQCISHDLSQAT
jgi:hypothetical protein